MLYFSQFTRCRASNVKRAYTTRRVPALKMQTLVSGDVKPVTGNLLLARVEQLGKHRKIERINGRRAFMLPGDEILVCYGNRYAPDQFEALVGDDLGLCDLVASGGIAAHEINRHDRMIPATKIMPIGLVGDVNGRPINIVDYCVDLHVPSQPITVVLVLGTAMNSGKTYTAASIVWGLKENGFRVAGIKATGTGSGGDLWMMKDMGADVVMDFTDAGFASTYMIPDREIEQAVLGLIAQAARRRCAFAVVEIADGLNHTETATLIRSQKLRSMTKGVVFAAHDSLGAQAGYRELLALGYSVLGVSGQVTRSPLAMRETAANINCPMYTPFAIQAGALMPSLTGTRNLKYAGTAFTQGREKEDSRPRNVVDFDLSQERLFQVRHHSEPQELGSLFSVEEDSADGGVTQAG